MEDKCPLKSSDSWKMLESQLGENLAWTTWINHGYNYPPSLKSTPNLRRDIGIPKRINVNSKAHYAKKIKYYNNKMGTSHTFNLEKVGQSDIREVILVPNYLNKNVEKQRVREESRKEDNLTKAVDPRIQNYKELYEASESEQEAGQINEDGDFVPNDDVDKLINFKKTSKDNPLVTQQREKIRKIKEEIDSF